MKEPDLKLLFDNGLLVKAIVTPAPMTDSYQLLFTKKDKEQLPLTLQRDPEPRAFKTIDSAIRVCKRLGFRVIEVYL